MGKRHRAVRSHLKLIVGSALKNGGLDDVPVKVALKVLRGGIAATTPLGFKVQDLGYKEDEFGELVSTIKKLTEYEIVDRMCARATNDIQRIEDARMFADLEQAASPGLKWERIDG